MQLSQMNWTSSLRLPVALDSNMVLQRSPKAARLWGWAAAGEHVGAVLEGVPPMSTIADASGRWNLTLPPQPASLVGRTITITAKESGGMRNLTDVLFGDVFLCSGQSHMSFSVNQDLDGRAEIAASASYPGLRMLTVADDCQTKPSTDLRKVKYYNGSAWARSEPSSFGNTNFGYPSAICYFFARHLYSELGGIVPVGFLSAAVGGSAIEFWMSDAARSDASCGGVAVGVNAACPGSQNPAFNSANDLLRGDVTPPGSGSAGWSDGCFFNAMVSPLAPMVLRGLLWDQGEANYKDSCAVWGCKLASLAKDWRQELFHQDDMLFTFDQLRADPQAAGIGSRRLAAAIDGATYTSRVDLQTCLANDTSEGHSTRKVEVGRRLSLAALVRAYGRPPSSLTSGPIIIGWNNQSISQGASQSAAGSLINISIKLNFSHQLHHWDAPECAGCCRGATGPLIQGTPKTGDSWSFVHADLSISTVCVEAPPSSGAATLYDCDGAANIVQDGGGAGSIWMLVHAPTSGSPITKVVYGGTGPWLAGEAPDATFPGRMRDRAGTPPLIEASALSDSSLKCVYPHQPRYGIEACALYNGIGGYDGHQAIAMSAQWAPLS